MPKSKTPKLFGWPDVMVLIGAAILLPAAIVQRNWFFLGVGVAIILAIVARMIYTRRVIRKTTRD